MDGTEDCEQLAGHDFWESAIWTRKSIGRDLDFYSFGSYTGKFLLKSSQVTLLPTVWVVHRYQISFLFIRNTRSDVSMLAPVCQMI